MAVPPKPISILFHNWRDCRNPEGGGSEIYVETVARALAAGGNEVMLHSAAFPGGASEEEVDGVRIMRSGSKVSVYPNAFRALRRGDLGTPDVVIDVQNGVPFASPWATSAPTVVLVHHVHREQWPVVYDPLRARIGWWLESRLAPRVYRDSRYVAVSHATKAELITQGITPERISVVHNGVQSRLRHTESAPALNPHIVVLGRLVPHKRVEHVLEAAANLLPKIPELTISIVGDGWWRAELEARAAQMGLADIVTFHGFVDDDTKQRHLQRAWVLALPSLKEGWGLVTTEAASHGVPTVAYRSAGGVAEAIRDGQSGLLVDGDVEDFTDCLGRILLDDKFRRHLSDGARDRADSLSWQSTAENFAAVLAEVVGSPVPVGEVRHESTLHAMDVEDDTAV